MGNIIKKFLGLHQSRKQEREVIHAAEIFRRDFLEANPHMIDRDINHESVEDRFRHAIDVNEENAFITARIEEMAEIRERLEKDSDEYLRKLAKDTRYNEPKGKPTAEREDINRTIDETEIYSRVKERILDAQRDQVGYGMGKYPEPLNADTWTILETIDHSISEKIDDLHYTMMLRIKLEEELKHKGSGKCWCE